MVDELTQELAKMGEDVILVTPYYEKNKKGQSGYLEADGIKYLQNVEVICDGVKQIVGVHEGTVNGVRLFWLHHVEFFYTPYSGEDPVYVMK